MKQLVPGSAVAIAIWIVAAAGAGDGWIEFTDETGTRLVADVDQGTGDDDEKDLAWGDLDNDGDIDLVIVRKQPFTSTGKRTNILFMNEAGVLVDRTSSRAVASDVPGDQGFLTPTNDRDVVLVDVNLDGWLDAVTAPTLSDGDPKHVSHPRVYMNLGEDGGTWLGLRFENDRIPLMHEEAGPRFTAVSAGDLTGDGAPDLYFGDYDSGGAQVFDFNNRLLVNDGTGVFTDETVLRLTFEMYDAAFGASNAIADMNGDGVLDVVKLTTLNAPTHVAVTYNDPANVGFFEAYDLVYQQAPYFVSVGDLNGDGLLDMIITDDGADRYMLNLGNDGAGHADFSMHTLPEDFGLGGNSLIVDLDEDGLNDIVVADVHDDIPGCNRTTLIFRNDGTGFVREAEVLPGAALGGVHDLAVFDLDGDGWKDLVIGRCDGTSVWIQEPQEGLEFSYPGGLPDLVPPGASVEIVVHVEAVGNGVIEPGSLAMHTSVNGGPLLEQPLVDLGGGDHLAVIEGQDCLDRIGFHVSGQLASGAVFTDPPTAPLEMHRAIVASSASVVIEDDVEGDVASWTVQNGPGLASGRWEQALPIGTYFAGAPAAPAEDATEAGTLCWLTGVDVDPALPAETDVDGGPTMLVSPAADVTGGDARITYARWLVSTGGGGHVVDPLTVDVSNDGGATWTAVPEQTTEGTGGVWLQASFMVSDHVEPTADVRVRFSIADVPNNSITEAAIDDFKVEHLVCAACTADITADGQVDVQDLTALIVAWGTPDAAADVNADGTVNVADLTALIIAWGPCG